VGLWEYWRATGEPGAREAALRAAELFLGHRLFRSWTLYWRDRNLRFHLYDLLAPSNRVDGLLNEIDRDPTCIFWG
jgi:hypothetical protein